LSEAKHTRVFSVESDMRARCGRIMSPLLEKHVRLDLRMLEHRKHFPGEVLAVETVHWVDTVETDRDQTRQHWSVWW